MIQGFRRVTLLLATLYPLHDVPGQSSTIGNGLVDLTYRVDAGLGLIVERLNEAAGPRSLLFNPLPIWRIELHDPTGALSNASIDPTLTTMPPVIYTAPAMNPSGLAAVWPNFPCPGGGSCVVAVTAEALPSEPVVEFRIYIDATASSWSLYDVEFPRVQMQPVGADPSQERLAVPFIGGHIIHQPRSDPYVALHRTFTDWIQPGFLSMQWFAYYNDVSPDGTNVFFGTRDPNGHAKRHYFDTAPSMGQSQGFLGTSMRVFPRNHLQTKIYNMEFGYVVGLMSGDWYDAARFYKLWATAQPWAAKGPIRTNEDFSTAIREADMFAHFAPASCPGPVPPLGCVRIVNRQNFQYWRRDLDEQKAYFGVSNIPSHVKFWDFNGFDANRGEWLPANATFISAGTQIPDAFSVYHVPSGYSHNVPGYPFSPAVPGTPLPSATRVLESGSLFQVTVNTPDINLVCDNQWTCPYSKVEDRLCLAAPFTSTYTAWVFTQVANAFGGGSVGGGAYLDVFSHTAPEPCYASQHGHAAADTQDYARGMRDLLANLRQTMKTIAGPRAFVHSESQQEFFLDVLDLVYENVGFMQSFAGNLAGAQIFHAPLFETVYHEYQRCATHLHIHETPGAPFLTNPARLHSARQYSALRTAFGGVPFAGSVLSPATMAANIASYPNYAMFTEFVQRTMHVLARSDVKPYFVYGERMRSPALNGVQSRVGPDGLLGYNLLRLLQPYVYCAAFTRPDLQEAGILLLNWTDSTDPGGGGNQTVDVVLDAISLGLPPGTYTITQVNPQGAPVLLGSYALNPTATVTQIAVPERSAMVLKVQ